MIDQVDICERVAPESNNTQNDLRVYLVGVKIILPKNNFLILRCLVKQRRLICFQGKIIFPRVKENILTLNGA